MATETEDAGALISYVLAKEDYFEILGVDRGDDEKVITKSYRKLALRLHPDKCSLPQAEDAFKKVSAAFACLRDADSRAHYEQFGKEPGAQMSHRHVDPNDLFREMFEAMAKAQQEGRAGPGGMGPGGFTFTSFGGANNGVFVVNGTSLTDKLPPWLQPIAKAIPPQVYGLVFFLIIFNSLAFLMGYLHLIIPVGMFAPSRTKGPLILLIIVLGLLGQI